MPTNHFDGVNEWGYVSHWEEIAQIDFGDGLKLPLIVNFRSDRAGSSAYLGSGWTLPLLESRFVQRDERTFEFIQPNGIPSAFSRKGPKDTLLRGASGWMAEIQGDTITAKASCGWGVKFVRGKIVSIVTPKNRKIEFVYDGNRVAELRENGDRKLLVDFDPGTGCIKVMSFNSRRIDVSIGDRPSVRVIAGQTVVERIEKTLVGLTTPGGADYRYEFSVDSNRWPTLKLSGRKERLLTWHPETRLIVSDSEWKYDIRPTTGSFAFASIQRKNERGQTEFWFKDLAKRQETIKWASDPYPIVTSRFAGAGPLAGKVRRVEVLKNGTAEEIKRFVYDESGKINREVSKEEVKVYHYDKAGRLTGIDGEKLGTIDEIVYKNSARWASVLAKLSPVVSDRAKSLAASLRVEHGADGQTFELLNSAECTLVRQQSGKSVIEAEFDNLGRCTRILVDGRPYREMEYYGDGEDVRQKYRFDRNGKRMALNETN